MTPERDGYPPESVELPAPTAWPMVVALGITLAFAGMITHEVVSAVGIALGLIAGIGWYREVLPEQQVERIALRPVELPPAAPPSRSSRTRPGSRAGSSAGSRWRSWPSRTG